MNRVAIAQRENSLSSLQHTKNFLNRKCSSCGSKIVSSGECSTCANTKSSIQRRPSIRASDDALKQTAENVINRKVPARESVNNVAVNFATLSPDVGHVALQSPCSQCEDEENLNSAPLPGKGASDTHDEDEEHALESWVVGNNVNSYISDKAQAGPDLLRSWVVGGPAARGTNTIKCDGSGGIAVQTEGTGNAAQTACLGDCITQHEQSHRSDALAANATICDGVAAGNIVTVNTAAERKATEVKASNVEISCLRAKPDTDACRDIIAARISQMIAYRDSF